MPLADDGSLTLEHPMADVDWAIRHVLPYGTEAEVIATLDVREKVRVGMAVVRVSCRSSVVRCAAAHLSSASVCLLSLETDC